MLLLLGPGVLLLTLLCPLVLLMACVGLGSFGGVVRYIQLLQVRRIMCGAAGSDRHLVSAWFQFGTCVVTHSLAMTGLPIGRLYDQC
jgi:hypothetical protein